MERARCFGEPQPTRLPPRSRRPCCRGPSSGRPFHGRLAGRAITVAFLTVAFLAAIACGSPEGAPAAAAQGAADAAAADGQRSPLEARFLGPAVRVTEGMTKAGEGYFSPDGRRIAYQAVPPGYPFYQIFVQEFRPDRPGPLPPRRVSPGRGRTTCAWFSPDGRRLLFASSHLDPNIDRTEATAREEAEADARAGRRRRYQWDFDPQMDLFVADLDAGAGDIPLERLTAEAGYDAECSFAPDGETILFVSDRAGAPDLYLMDRDGGNLRRLTATPAYDGGPFFSPDGGWITYRTDRVEKDRLQIHVMRADGSGDVAVTSGEAVHWAPFWHPTKPWLVWTGADHSDPTRRPNYDLWIVRYDVGHEASDPATAGQAAATGFRTTRPLRLTDHPSADVLPSFSPDGELLLWTSGRGADPGGREASSQLWVSRLDLEAVEAALAALPLEAVPLDGGMFTSAMEPPPADRGAAGAAPAGGRGDAR